MPTYQTPATLRGNLSPATCASRIFEEKLRTTARQYCHCQVLAGSDFDPPPPNPRIPYKGFFFCNQVSNGNSYLGEPGHRKNCSHCSFQGFHSLTKGNQVSLVRNHFSHPESDGKSPDVGVGGRIRISIVVQPPYCQSELMLLMYIGTCC